MALSERMAHTTREAFCVTLPSSKLDTPQQEVNSSREKVIHASLNQIKFCHSLSKQLNCPTSLHKLNTKFCKARSVDIHNRVIFLLYTSQTKSNLVKLLIGS